MGVMLYKSAYGSVSVSVLTPNKTCYYISRKVLTLRTSRKNNWNNFSYCSLAFLQSYAEFLASGRLSVPLVLRNGNAVILLQCCHGKPVVVLGAGGRWQMQQATVTVNTYLPPKSQRPYLPVKTFWGDQSRSVPRVRVRNCLLTEARQVLLFPHDKSIFSHVRWNSSTQPKRKDMISAFRISVSKSFCLQKTIFLRFPQITEIKSAIHKTLSFTKLFWWCYRDSAWITATWGVSGFKKFWENHLVLKSPSQTLGCSHGLIHSLMTLWFPACSA